MAVVVTSGKIAGLTCDCPKTSCKAPTVIEAAICIETCRVVLDGQSLLPETRQTGFRWFLPAIVEISAAESDAAGARSRKQHFLFFLSNTDTDLSRSARWSVVGINPVQLVNANFSTASNGGRRAFWALVVQVRI